MRHLHRHMVMDLVTGNTQIMQTESIAGATIEVVVDPMTHPTTIGIWIEIGTGTETVGHEVDL